jgi:hypothetical protein
MTALLLVAYISICFVLAELFGRAKQIGRWWMFWLMLGAFFLPGIVAYFLSPDAVKNPGKPNKAIFYFGSFLIGANLIGLIPALYAGPNVLSIPLSLIIIGLYLFQLGRGKVENRNPKQYFNQQHLTLFMEHNQTRVKQFTDRVSDFKDNNEVLYFLVEDNKPSKPYNYEQLKPKRIKEDALVWRKGLDNWIAAGELSELYNIIVLSPPVVPHTPPPIPKVAKAIEVDLSKNQEASFDTEVNQDQSGTDSYIPINQDSIKNNQDTVKHEEMDKWFFVASGAILVGLFLMLMIAGAFSK